MKKRNFLWVLNLIAVFGMPLGAVEYKAPTTEQISAIEAASPSKPAAPVKQSRKLLVMYRCDGFVHESVLMVNKALECMGKKTGAFEPTFTDDLNAFLPVSLARYDAVLLNNSTRLKIDNPQWRQGLLEFVKSGKGLIGIHAATDNFYDWPEGAAMLGGLFDSHPWRSKGTWAFQGDDPAHPLCKPFTEGKFSLSDEIYYIVTPYSRAEMRVLLSLDLEDPVNQTPKEFGPAILDAPVSWVKEYGKGRVFYCSLGHNFEVFTNPKVMEHYLAGIQFALGDLPAETKSLFVDWKSFETNLAAFAAYEYGQSPRPYNGIELSVRNGSRDEPTRGKLEEHFIRFLQGSATNTAKGFICRQLRIVGSEKCADVFAPMLLDPEMSDMARYAMESIPGEKVNAALRNAMKQTEGKVRIGMINTLGQRRDAGSVAMLAEWIGGGDAEASSAAVAALAKISGPEVLAILEQQWPKASEEAKKTEILQAMLACADQLKSQGQNEPAKRVYTQLNAPTNPWIIRAGATRGLLAISQTPGAAILEVLQQNDPDTLAVAVGMLGEMKTVDHLKEIAAQRKNLSPLGQVQLLQALSRVGDASVTDEVKQAVQSDQAEVRIAALETLANLKDDSAVMLLAQTAASAKGAEQAAARQSLYSLYSANVDQIIVSHIPGAEPALLIELLLAVKNRVIPSAVEPVMALPGDAPQKIRMETFRTLKEIAAPEHLTRVLELLHEVKDPTVRTEAAYAVRNIIKQIKEEKSRSDALAAAMAKYDNRDYRAAILGIIPECRTDDSSLEMIRGYAKDNDPDVKRAAIKAMAAWETPAPMEDLKTIATTTWQPEPFRMIATLGYLDMILMRDDLNADAKVALFREAMSFSANVQVRRTVLSGLSKLNSFTAVQMIDEYLKDNELKQEAAAAMEAVLNKCQKMLSPEGQKLWKENAAK